MVRLSGNIHGNEAVGREISLAFARFSVVVFVFSVFVFVFVFSVFVFVLSVFVFVFSVFVFVFVFSVFVFVFVRREISVAFARYLHLMCTCHTKFSLKIIQCLPGLLLDI